MLQITLFDQPDKLACSILTFRIAPNMGTPAFTARLRPLYSLKAQLLVEQISIIFSLVHSVTGYVFLIVHLSANLAKWSNTIKQFAGCRRQIV